MYSKGKVTFIITQLYIDHAYNNLALHGQKHIINYITKMKEKMLTAAITDHIIT